MAVSITKKLSVTPSHGKLPLTITFCQTLTTNVPPEEATTVYEIREPSGDTGFGTPGTKTFTTQKTVDAASSPFEEPIQLVGTLQGAILTIRQTLTDQSGSRLISHCSVNLKGGA